MTGIARAGVEGGVRGRRETQCSVWGRAAEDASRVKGGGGLGRPPRQSSGLGLILLAARTDLGSREYYK